MYDCTYLEDEIDNLTNKLEQSEARYNALLEMIKELSNLLLKKIDIEETINK